MITSPVLKKTFGHELQELRKAKGLSQEKLGYQVGLERAYISRMERGISQPTLTVLVELGKALGVSASEILARVEKRFQSSPAPK